ncbi:ribosome biogenesis GTPase YlqF [uncultured Oscillibacter sp.]|uniref:ribosome biogenesis GTPase YlqF n=1 Tax=uncultured Oscillibacter sp. TaxID=876091 RepID=UPI00260C4FE9|nr:ribosome biogenesis GTPase YlqF [uncultured Oscillibacter sp.]
MDIQWYPGHMTKTRRQIEADLKHVDIVVEIVDARIPLSSRNPDIDAICGAKPRLIILNRADQADPRMNQVWADCFTRRQGVMAVTADARSGSGVSRMVPAARQVLGEQIVRWKEKGLVGRPIRAMVVGVPNVGKSTFINKVAGRKSARAADRPGVTRGKQWVHADASLDLLDTPGILWPKLGDRQAGLNLAFTGAVKDEILDTETLGCHLMAFLAEHYPEALKAGYKLPALPEREEGENDVAFGYRLLETAGRRRGFLVSGGEIDTERMAKILLDEFRSGKLGRFTLEAPPEEE